MRHIFIINPTAGKGDWQQALVEKINIIMAGSEDQWEVYTTKHPGDGEEYVKDIAGKATDTTRFYACGGDGTLSEVVNGAAGYSLAEVAVYPAGSGNDFVKSLSKKACEKDIEALVNATAKAVDLIKINDRYAINECNIGFDAMVAFDVPKFKNLPFVSGPLAYNISLAKNFLSKTGYDFKFVLDDNEEISGKYLLCLVANGKYYGSGYKAAPYAVVDDGLLEVIMIKKMPRTKMAGLLEVYKNGEHLSNPEIKNIITYKRAKKVVITSKRKVAMCIDGDALVDNTFTMEVIPKSMNFVIPK